jgi:hypothetical protein
VRCSRCGNENPDGNRFCGMCGAALLSAPSVGASPLQRPATSAPNIPTAPAPLPSRPQTAEAPRSAPAPQPSPSISGPSFLGLNDRSPHRRTRASLSIDPHSSSNVDSLLDDEDEPRHRGAGKVLLILIALALAVGFGYLRWKNQGLSWLNLALHKPTAAVQNSDSTDSNSNAANAPASTSITPESQPSPAAPSSTAPSGAAQTPAASAPNGNPPAAAAPTATTPAAAPGATGPATTAPANNTAGAGDAGNATANPSAKPSDDGSSAATTQPSAAATPASSDNPPATAPSKPAPKPRAARPTSPAIDPVAEAQQYLYGRGSAQDCDRGLRILKPAANAGNPKAMIEMGALYSAGLCTPHDLPTAYRWFALALRKDPSNDQVQTDLQKLWSEMTQPERQLAIKLSQ